MTSQGAVALEGIFENSRDIWDLYRKYYYISLLPSSVMIDKKFQDRKNTKSLLYYKATNNRLILWNSFKILYSKKSKFSKYLL